MKTKDIYKSFSKVQEIIIDKIQQLDSSSKTNMGGTVTETDSDAPSTFGMAIGLGINIRLGGE